MQTQLNISPFVKSLCLMDCVMISPTREWHLQRNVPLTQSRKHGKWHVLIICGKKKESWEYLTPLRNRDSMVNSFFTSNFYFKKTMNPIPYTSINIFTLGLKVDYLILRDNISKTDFFHSREFTLSAHRNFFTLANLLSLHINTKALYHSY